MDRMINQMSQITMHLSQSSLIQTKHSLELLQFFWFSSVFFAHWCSVSSHALLDALLMTMKIKKRSSSPISIEEMACKSQWWVVLINQLMKITAEKLLMIWWTKDNLKWKILTNSSRLWELKRRTTVSEKLSSIRWLKPLSSFLELCPTQPLIWDFGLFLLHMVS